MTFFWISTANDKFWGGFWQIVIIILINWWRLPPRVARLKLMLFAGWSPAWPKCSLCCRKGLWSSHYVWQEFSLGGNWALVRLLTGWNYSCFMAYNQMLARHHQGTRKIVISDNIFVTGKCSDGETFQWTNFNIFKVFLLFGCCTFHTLCETLRTAWAAARKTKLHCSRAYLWTVVCTSLLRYSHLDKMKYLQLACK